MLFAMKVFFQEMLNNMVFSCRLIFQCTHFDIFSKHVDSLQCCSFCCKKNIQPIYIYLVLAATLWKGESKNTKKYQCRWPRIFRHEYIHLIFLREMGLDTKNYVQRKRSYVPALEDSCPKCSFLSKDGKCNLCESSEMSSFLNKLNNIGCS